EGGRGGGGAVFAEWRGGIDGGGEVVDGLRSKSAPAGVDDGGIVGRIQPYHHIIPGGGRNRAQRTCQDRCTDLGTATTAAHSQRRDFFDGVPIGNRRYRCRLSGGHCRQLIEPRHEATVDEVLDLPDPCTFERQPVACAQRVALPGRDEVQRLPLRRVGPRSFSAHHPLH